MCLVDYTLSEHSGRFVGWDLGARDGKVGRRRGSYSRKA